MSAVILKGTIQALQAIKNSSGNLPEKYRNQLAGINHIDTVIENLCGLLEEIIPSPKFDDLLEITAQMYEGWARGNDVTNRVDEVMEAYDKWLD